MALTTKTMGQTAQNDTDNTSEYYVAKDSEGKGYLAKRKIIKPEEPIIVEPVVEKPKVIKSKKAKKK